MNLRAFICVSFFFGWIVLTGLYGQSSGIYLKPHAQLGPDWDESSLEKWVLGYSPQLSATNSELYLSDIIESPGGKHISFHQSYLDQPIHKAGIKVNLDHKGKIYSLMDALKSFDPPSSQDLQYHVQESTIRQKLIKLTRAYEIQLEKKWWIDQEELQPVFVGLTFSHEEVVSYEFLIHGQTGEILSQEDRGAYFAPQQDTTGKGRVFLPDPCTQSETSYGDLITDANDVHLVAFDSLLDTVDLKGLTYENGLFHLKGPYVSIEDRAPFSTPPATSTTGDFFFTRDQSEFEDVMVYYHIDTFQRYIQHLGFTNLQNQPFLADPHGKSDLDQSVFVINGNSSYILFGDGGVDDAEDADVIIHEYGHALSHAAAPDTRSGVERKGLDEGIGDYFASSYSQDISNWGWHEVFIWDGHNEFWSGRVSVTSQTYPPSSTSIYDYGELWASTMMQIRNHIGPEVTDRLQLQELYGNYVGMSLADGARLLIDSDSMLYGGIHVETISDYFCQRNILEQSSCLSVSIEELEDPVSPLDVRPNPSTGIVDIILPANRLNIPWKVNISDVRGRYITERKLENVPSQQIQLGLPAGMYLLTFFADEDVFTTKKLIILEE
ncbi:MAG: T9SS type A sorting domain-containing protein [Bacteroidota bacterium]